MFLSVQSFQQFCPFIQNLNVASKGIALPKLSDSFFLCWNFVHIADVLGGGGVERDWCGDQYPGSGCGPLGAKKQLRMDEKRGIRHDDLPLFFFFTQMLQTVQISIFEAGKCQLSNAHIGSYPPPKKLFGCEEFFLAKCWVGCCFR